MYKLNIFETAWPIKGKFYAEPPWEGWTNVYINSAGHMTKMASMLIYNKIYLFRTRDLKILKLGMEQ